MTKIATIITVLLIISCQNPPNSIASSANNNGKISGKIVDQSGAGIDRRLVRILGTSFNAYTDSTGSFVIYNLPPGTYELSTYSSYNKDTIFAVIVLRPGENAQAHDYCIASPAPDLTHIFTVKESNIEGTNGTTLQNLSYTSGLFYVEIDTCLLVLNIRHKDNSPVRDSIIAFHNGETTFCAVPEKGMVRTKEMIFSGNDTLHIFWHNELAEQWIFLDSSYADFNYVQISLGRITLSPIGTKSFNRTVLIDSIPYGLNSPDPDNNDWDLILVNDAIGDSCYWANPKPDWGEINNGSDNPNLTSDEKIHVWDLSDGSYSAYVHLYKSSADSIAQTPILNIEFGRHANFKMLENLVSTSPDKGLLEGETWFAGKIFLPDRVFNTTGQEIIANE